jgi:hypothetical protein
LLGKHEGKGKLKDHDVDVSITLNRILQNKKVRWGAGRIHLVQDGESDGLL